MSAAMIRAAQPEDFQTVFRFFEQLWPEKTLDRAALQAVFTRALTGSNDAMLCAVEAEQVIGFCSIAFFNCFWHAGEIAYISTLVIDEARRGGGLGAMLLDQARTIATARGCRGVELDSLFHREAAHRFYQRHGFEKVAYHFVETNGE